MRDYIALDAAVVAAQMRALLVAFPELAEDESLAADMFEGETDLHSVVSRALEARQEAEGMVAGVKAREADLGARKARFQRKADAMKTLIRSLMDVAKQDKLTLPEATISKREPSASVEVLDAEALPQGYYRTVTYREGDKLAIAAAIKNKEPIPGARLVYGEPSVTIRTK